MEINMDIIKNVTMYILGFEPYVMLPFIILILAMIFRIKLSTAIKSSFTIGIGFIGIFVIFDYFVTIINPVIQKLISRAGLQLDILDAGWPPLAAITWAFSLAPLLLVILILLNIILLITKLTKTVNIDIWNYWHFIFAGALVYNISSSVFLSILASITTFIITIKLADWSAPMLHKFSGLKGISVPTLSAVAYFPFGVLGNKLIDYIPFVNKINANPEKIKEKMGLIGEPMIIGFILGVLLGIGAGCDIRQIAEFAFGIAAVIYILPKMANIVGTSLIPISEGMKDFIKKHFPKTKKTYIGLDVAVIIGLPSVVVTSILLIPVSLALAFILPGVRFIPLGDLVNLVVIASLLCVATKGNVVRSFLIGIPIVILHLYLASNMAYLYTRLAGSVNFSLADYDGIFTSFLDGGNALRVWTVETFSGNIYAFLLLPVVVGVLYLTRKFSSKNN
ncbi:PTS transporter subunit IIC [Herbivorax sp. ANBcel31]|uniref:PTS transporter subunit IIC n=1 Tax=Herbivorax sp. ANBcel31 TaxID=3069754 RepID=UPI0027B11A79|nr:PTS transporter subunit IIC [Herbivorax sp. ANBcel31]MDQ2086726.1 PTS transporter subunit IIC [Herbivorax sp. ANBcel31]